MSLRPSSVWSLVGAVALVFAATGCAVTTKVTLAVNPSGGGFVAVTVTMDQAALGAVGGIDRLRSELAVNDLKAAGWSVTGPTALSVRGSGATARQTGTGGAVISVRHGFSGLDQAQTLISEVAGPGVFQVQLAAHHSFWHTTYHLTGAVDLTCGINCFGDAGLRSATGSPVGVDPGALSAQSGQKPDDVFTFQFDGRLPGHVHAGAGGTVRPGGSVLWAPVLGQKVLLSASSQSGNRAAVEEVGSGVAILLLLIASFALWRAGKWLRPRFWPKHVPQHRKRDPAETVTPPP